MKGYLVIVIFVFYNSTLTFGCSCGNVNLDTIVKRSSAILIGEIIAIDTVDTVSGIIDEKRLRHVNKKKNFYQTERLLKSTLVIESMLKGDITKDTIIFFSGTLQCCNCSVPVYTGMKTILLGKFFSKTELIKNDHSDWIINRFYDSNLFTSVCWLSQNYSKEFEDEINEKLKAYNTQ